MQKYKAILVDPPWTWKTYSEKGKGRSAEAHYECMSFDDIKALPVAEMADDDCVLFLWVTDPLLPKAFELFEAWGFTYKTVGFYWVKQNKKTPNFFTGMGYWTRANPEQCLLATKGKPKKKSSSVQRLLISKIREHSRKPDEIYQRIEELVDGPYLELFARQTKLGWDSWGNQVGLFDFGHVETRNRPSTNKGDLNTNRGVE